MALAGSARLKLLAHHPLFLPACLALHAALVALLVRPLPRRVAVAGVAALVAWWPVGTWLGRRVPAGWTRPMRETFGEGRLDLLKGKVLGTDALTAALHGPTWGHPATVHDQLGTAVAHHGVAALLLGALAARLGAPPLAAVVLGVAWAFGTAGVHAALTLTEAPTAAVYLLLAAHGHATARDGHPATGLLLMLGAAAALALVRPELAAAALLWAGATAALGIDRVAAGVDRAAASALALARGHPVAAAAVAATWLWTSTWERFGVASPDSAVGWLLAAYSPVNAHGALSLPVLAVGALAPGLAILALLGLARGVARPSELGPVALLTVGLWLAYHQAGHGPWSLAHAGRSSAWELYRYGLLLAPWLGVLAAHAAARRAPVALLAATLLPPVPEALVALAPVVSPAEHAWPRVGLLDGDHPRAARALLAAAEANPTCALVTRALPWPARPLALRWHVLWREPRRWRDVVVDAPADADPLDVIARSGAPAPCAIGWRDLDCDAVGAGGCPSLDALPRGPWGIEEAEAPWVHPDHGVTWQRPSWTGTVLLDDRPP